MLKRLLLVLAIALAPIPASADIDSVRDRIVQELREDGYYEIRMNRTWLSRLRFVATRDDAVREIVVNPNTGVILRDYVKFLRRSGSGGGSSGSSNDDDYDDDKYDDDEYDDEYDNSGSGSYNSGSGSDDDVKVDNSGSGSANSGSGSDDD